MVKLRRKKASNSPAVPVIPVILVGENTASNRHVGAHPCDPRAIRLLSVPDPAVSSFLWWCNTTIPPLEVVGQGCTRCRWPPDAPLPGPRRRGLELNEFDRTPSAMVVLEAGAARPGQSRLLRQNSSLRCGRIPNTQNVQDFWGDPLTAPGAQSADGKAAYVQIVPPRRKPGRAWPTSRFKQSATWWPNTPPRRHRRLRHRRGRHDVRPSTTLWRQGRAEDHRRSPSSSSS